MIFRDCIVAVIKLMVIIIIINVPIVNAQKFKIVHTGITSFYSSTSVISAPSQGSPYYGQDANYQVNKPSYTDNHNGTVNDNITGLMWQKDMGSKITFADAKIKADTMKLGGYSDWRIPTIKELYSLIQYTGRSGGAQAIKKFIDTVYFNQPIGNISLGEREIDAQTWSCTQYKGIVFTADSALFGVNFIDGRIKGYPKYKPGSNYTVGSAMYFRMVRGNANYGINDFIDNQDGTITDRATGLMWQQADDGTARDWQGALSYAENLTLAGYSDWRLPSVKELQSIVDYSRGPQSTHSAAISPLFATTMINYPGGSSGQYPYFWSGTTHLDGANPYASAAYVAFGEALGMVNGVVLDVHGAGAQRSDPKTGNPAEYPQYFGPQGDLRNVQNYVRCVRNISTPLGVSESKNLPAGFDIKQNYPNPFNPDTVITYQISQTVQVNLKVFDTIGREVATLVNGEKNPGSYSVGFNARNLPSGIYLCVLSSGSFSKCMKMICLK